MADVDLFVSHSGSDDTVVDEICEKLKQAGINNIWVDHNKGLRVGDDWISKIQHALVSCRALLLVLSPRSAVSSSCKNEWFTALELKKPVYVALVEHVDPNDFPWRLRSIQWANLERRFEQDINELTAALLERREAFFGSETILSEAIPDAEKIDQDLQIVKRIVRNMLPQESTFEYGLALRNLGETYYDLALGSTTDRKVFLLQALNYFGQALHHLRQHDTLYLALVEADLANTYCELATIDEPQLHLRFSLEMYQVASGHVENTIYSSVCAMINANQSNAFGELAKYEDPLANLHKAVDVLEKALSFYDSNIEVGGYASAQNNLGNIYRQLVHYENRTTNLRNACDAYEEAAKVADSPSEAAHRATAQANLGSVYRDLADLEDVPDNKRKYLESARTACRLALDHFSPEKFPLEYLRVQNILGNVYRAWADIEDRTTNWQKAIKAYEASLNNLEHQDVPFDLDVAGIYYNLGEVHRRLAGDGIEPDLHLREAIKALEQSRKLRDPELVPLEFAETQTVLGLAYAKTEKYADAIKCWSEAEHWFRKKGVMEKADRVLAFINQAKQKLA